jgi:thermopsin
MTGIRLVVASGVLLVVVLMLGSALASANAAGISTVSGSPVSVASATEAGSSPSAGAVASPEPNSVTFGTNARLASTVANDERTLAANGRSASAIHPPNLHQAPSLSSTGGVVTPLYDIAPAPMGEGYFGLSNTSGRTVSTTVDTTSLAGTYSTSDPLGVQTEEFDVPTGPSYNDIQPAFDSYGAQLNSVITNVSVFGHTSFYNPSDPDAPTGCPGYGGNPTTGPAPCPNEFWLQNYIEYVPATGMMQIGDEIWNFSNPTASWGLYNGSTVDQNTLVGFGSINYGLYYLTNTPSEYGPTIHMPYPFTLALYLNVTRGPCHTDAVPGTGVPSCTVDGSTVSTTAPVNEIFFNYSVFKTPSQPCPTGDVCQGQRVCPAVEPYAGIVCGEYDDIFFNSVNPSTPAVGVPEHGPNGRIGSAAIEANGSAYDPVGLTNDFEFDYGIGSDDGDTNGVVYANGTVAVDYCTRADTLPSGACSSFSATPSATDFGGETGETSTGEVGYWAPQSTSTGAGFLTRPGSPLVHAVTGPSLLEGLWNMSGVPYPGGSGAHALSYAHIAPANAWVGIAAGKDVRNQAAFQVAPTFGWFSYWKGSGGATVPTELGSDLYLPVGEYTIEVLLSGQTPYIGNVDLRSGGQAPSISLTPDPGTGVYTPLWAFSSSDLANISLNGRLPGAGSPADPYRIDYGTPTVGAPFGEDGSLSWLFSNLNDYLFPVWYGEFLNSTSAYAESNPAPSLEMDYPSWQSPNLNFFDVPMVRDFQMYFWHVRDFTLAGTPGITTWGMVESVPVAAVTFEDGQHDLVAKNTFAVSDEGLAFLGGATSVPAHGFSGNVRNIVWGNTFNPYPQSNSYGGLFEPSTALTIHENFDRIYNNAFHAVSASLVATVSSPAGYSDWWNVTCQSGYEPLASMSYPGPVACEPLSYSQVANGFTLTGSILPTHYQGGNAWAVYGNSENPYGTLPFRDLGPYGPPGIGSTEQSFAGDYAPLITRTVYRVTFTETGLPSSDSPSAFQVQVTNLFPGRTAWTNESTTDVLSPSCGGGPVCVTFYVPIGVYEFQVSVDHVRGTTYLPDPAMGFLGAVSPHSELIKIVFVHNHDSGAHVASVADVSRRR